MWDVLLATSPILVVLGGMFGLKKPAVVVTPIAMAYTLLVGLLHFDGTAGRMADSLEAGILGQEGGIDAKGLSRLFCLPPHLRRCRPPLHSSRVHRIIPNTPEFS